MLGVLVTWVLAVGLAGGVTGTALLWLLLRRLRLGEVLGANAQLAAVIAVAAACDVVREDAGLIAAIFMGLALAKLIGQALTSRRGAHFSKHSCS